ncbi:MAG: 4-hydroxy-tetrahydrodipicolinate synthase [Rhodothalassiaceae bacterium]|nr:MAG: 4-hydroxy-tetrahydrodipicolinate synthase [Rhodothalassiaceae bacterium]
MLSGSLTALVTPFDEDGRLDREALAALVDWQIAQGTHGLVPCGTTGEAPTLAHEEWRQVIATTVETAAGRVPVVAGCGSYDTAATIARVNEAGELGAAAALIVAPYYNKPTQDGLFAHFRAVHDATRLPIVIYNIPGRTAVDVAVETLARLAELERIIGVKDATGNLARVALQRRACGPDFIQLSGEDMTAVGFNAMGGAGCISVTANVAPGLCARLQEACRAGDYATALALQDRLAPLHEALFLETSPAPVKYALFHLGRIASPAPRLPLVAPREQTRRRIEAALAACLDAPPAAG